MSLVLIVHPDAGFRAHLAEILAGSDLDVELTESEELTAADRLIEPDVVVTALPPAGGGNGDGRATFPQGLTTVPRVIVLDVPTGETLQWALQLHPAGVLRADSPPELFVHVVRGALEGQSMVLDQSLAPLLAEEAARGLIDPEDPDPDD